MAGLWPAAAATHTGRGGQEGAGTAWEQGVGALHLLLQQHTQVRGAGSAAGAEAREWGNAGLGASVQIAGSEKRWKTGNWDWF